MHRTAYSPWTNGKVEVQNKHLSNYLRHFNSRSGSIWPESTGKFAFSHNTAENYGTGYTPLIPAMLLLVTTSLTTHEMGITLHRTAYSPWTNGKVEVQNKHLSNYPRHFNSRSGSNWPESTSKFAFSLNTAENYSTGYTPCKIILGKKTANTCIAKVRTTTRQPKEIHISFVVIYHHTHRVMKLVFTKIRNHCKADYLRKC